MGDSGVALDHYKIDGPAVIAFSGGSTSGYMLYHILQAHGGTLPTDVVVAFANTGAEHPKTLDFIHACETRWNVKIHWLEFTGNKGFQEVSYETASRTGEPFNKIINERKYLPNPMTRFCTAELKIRTMERFALSLGWADGHTEVIGIRRDEPKRFARMQPARAANDVYCPLYHAGVDVEMVDSFWFKHPFKLEIPQMLGNCTGCFLKSAGKIATIAETAPELLKWWAEKEDQAMQWKLQGLADSGKFREDRPSYHGFIQMAKDQLQFCFPEKEDDSLPCACTD